MRYDAVIIGAGLAGCSTAIHLALSGHRVLLIEKKVYPVHKLCGEFLSPEVGHALVRLGVLDRIRNAGAHTIQSYLLSSPSGKLKEGVLPMPALGLSRYRFDELLLNRAIETGVEVWSGVEARGLQGNAKNGFDVETESGTAYGRIVVGAYGKRNQLDRKLGRSFFTSDEPYVAFKQHFRGKVTEDRIEVHAFDGGYCGLVAIEEDLTNACCIVHRDTLKKSAGKGRGQFDLLVRKNPVLFERMQQLTPVWESPISISQISFRRKGLFERDVCMAGDTAGMIAPLCGDGMAIAIETGELLAGLIGRMLDGKMRIDAFASAYRRSWNRMFLPRFIAGRVVQWGFVKPFYAELALHSFQLFPGLTDWVIRRTRGVIQEESLPD